MYLLSIPKKLGLQSIGLLSVYLSIIYISVTYYSKGIRISICCYLRELGFWSLANREGVPAALVMQLICLPWLKDDPPGCLVSCSCLIRFRRQYFVSVRNGKINQGYSYIE